MEELKTITRNLRMFGFSVRDLLNAVECKAEDSLLPGPIFLIGL
jgi:hypothetical protein